MARVLRIQYSGAVYHVTCRGNDRQDIFRDDEDRKRLGEKLRKDRKLLAVMERIETRLSSNEI